jgi:hypothetical protein
VWERGDVGRMGKVGRMEKVGRVRRLIIFCFPISLISPISPISLVLLVFLASLAYNLKLKWCDRPHDIETIKTIKRREFDSAISAARRAAEMVQKGAPRDMRGTFLRSRRIHVKAREKISFPSLR